MQTLPSRNLARTTIVALGVAVASSAMPTGASAQTTISGGGATLPALTLRQLFDCFSGTGTPPGVCTTPVNPLTSFVYNSVGSGAGQRGWASQDPVRLGGTPLVADVNFAISEAALTSSQLNTFNNGGQFSSTGPTNIANVSDTCVAPATGTGGDTVPPAGCYDNPRVENGPAIQIPLFAVPVTIAFDPVYKRVRNADGTVSEFRYQIIRNRPDGSGGLRLSQEAYCAIFSGQLTSWNDARLRQFNAAPGTLLWPDPADPDTTGNVGRELRVVVRDDDSGTTALFARHLRAVCPQWASATPAIPATGAIQAFPGNPSPNSIPAGDFATCQNDGNGTFSGFGSRLFYARGSEGVSLCIDTDQPGTTPGSVAVGGRVGYLSPDFTLPAVNNLPVGNPYREAALQTADLQTVASVGGTPAFRGPQAQFVQAALAASFGVPPVTSRNNPLAWVASPDALIGGSRNPVAAPAGTTSYPIVGTTNWLGYTCYSSVAKTRAVGGTAVNPSPTNPGSFLNWFYANGSQVNSILLSNGFVPLPLNLRTAIRNTFLVSADPDALNLFIRSRTTAAPGFCSTGS